MKQSWLVVFILNDGQILKVPIKLAYPIDRMQAREMAKKTLAYSVSQAISACQIKVGD